MGRLRVGVDGDVGGAELRFERLPVAGVAELVEFFAGVFDGQLRDGRGRQDFVVDCAVELRAVARSLVGWEQEELRDAQARFELLGGDWGKVGVLREFGGGFSWAGCWEGGTPEAVGG